MEKERLPLACSLCKHITPDYDGKKPNSDKENGKKAYCGIDMHDIENPKQSPPVKCPLFKPTKEEIERFQKNYGGGKIKSN